MRTTVAPLSRDAANYNTDDTALRAESRGWAAPPPWSVVAEVTSCRVSGNRALGSITAITRKFWPVSSCCELPGLQQSLVLYPMRGAVVCDPRCAVGRVARDSWR